MKYSGSILLLLAMGHAKPLDHDLQADVSDIKNMMESGKAGASKLPAVTESLPKIESDGQVDMESHRLNDKLFADVKAMQLNMLKHEGDGNHKTALTAAAVKNGEATMSRADRASRWFASHGMKKMQKAFQSHPATSAVEDKPAAVVSRKSTKDLVINMDDDDSEKVSWSAVDKLKRQGLQR